MNDKPHSPPNEPTGELIWIAGGGIDAVSVTLRFFGDNLDPEEITAKLGIQPTKCCRKGDIYWQGRYRQTQTTGKWILRKSRRADRDLSTEVDSLMKQLTQDYAVWYELTSRFDASILCGLWLAKWNGATELEVQTLQALSARRLRLELDLYFDQGTEEE